MKIGINARYLANGDQRGLNRYTVNLIRALVANHGINISLLSDRPLDPVFDTLVPGRRVVFRARPHVWWEQGLLPRYIFHEGLDVFHAPADWGLPYRRVCPQVLTLHSLCSRVLGQFPGMTWKVRAKDSFSTWISIRRADAIIVVSECVRQDLLRIFSVPADRVHVIYQAADPAFRPLEDNKALREGLDRLGVQQPYFLYVGGFEPWKNVSTLITAFADLGRRDVNLVLAGPTGSHSDVLRAVARQRGVEGRVHLTGYLDDDCLVVLYNAALALVHPSLYESFGFPLVEAMQCGIPVAASGRGGMREVLGDAALFFDPTDVLSLASALGTLAEDADLRRRLSAAGVTRAASFSWDTTAKATAELYEAVSLRRATR